MIRSHEDGMRAAIEAARGHAAAPFGAVIVDPDSGGVLARGCNDSARDPTAHGEIAALRSLWAAAPPAAPKRLVLYSTAEPCAMCQSALLWAGLGCVVYGTSIPTLVRLGWPQADLRADEIEQRTPFAEMRLLGGILEAECDALFRGGPP